LQIENKLINTAFYNFCLSGIFCWDKRWFFIFYFTSYCRKEKKNVALQSTHSDLFFF